MSLPHWPLRACAALTLLLGAGMLAVAGPGSALLASSPQAVPGAQGNGTTTLVNGRTISPAGSQTTLWNLPMNAILAPDGNHLLVANAGAYDPEMLQTVDTATRHVAQSLPYRSPASVSFGLAYSPDGTRAFAADGSTDAIHTFVINGRHAVNPGRLDTHVDTLTAAGDISVGPGNGSAYPYGLAITPDGATLLAADNLANQVSVIDLGSQTVVATIPAGHYPYTVVVAANGKRAYVSNWADATVSAIDLTKVATTITAAAKTPVAVRGVTQTIKVGNHPTAMVFSPDGVKLYVADANSDAISVIDTSTSQVTRTISVAPYQGAPLSSSPTSLAISADGGTLYAANSGEDAIAVIDTAAGSVRGRIPTAWYPSSVVLSKDGRTLFVTNAKGLGGGPNANPATDPNPTRKVSYDSYCNCSQDQYTGSYIMGTLSTIPVPDAATLAGDSRRVQANNHVGDAALLQRSASNPVPMPGGKSVFTHVIYINKENRTYDQVFGDVRGANGDPSLALFGQNVTPNLHALVHRFGLLDNFYADAEVSADGHNWINGANASDYNEKMWPIDYSWGLVYRNRGYDFEGGSLINNNPGGYLWDAAHAAGVTYRDYGNFYALPSQSYVLAHGKVLPASQAAACPGPVAHSLVALPKGLSIPAGAVFCYPAEHVNPLTTPNLVGHFDPRYHSFDLHFSEADRFAEWKREFDQFVTNGQMPALELLRMPNDHTEGTSAGYRTPAAYVAENDQYVGEVVDAVSHSPYWKNTLIVVTEDDAQNGPDHVDGHRTTSLVISAYNSHDQLTVDHTLYDTSSMVRTVELVLGLKPMSQYDAQATPMWRLFNGIYNATPYSVTASNIAPATLNAHLAPGAALSASLNFAVEDRAPAGVLNHLIWRSVKGQTAYPVTHYSVRNGADDK